MESTFAPILAILAVIGCATAFGVAPMRKLIEVREARHELRHGSPGFFRTISGWIIIAFWLAGTWFLATVIGDWWATGDLEGAMERSGQRLRILLEILAHLADD